MSFFKKRTTKEGQQGSATVEACISFTGFLFVVFTILNVINYCRVQSLVSAAVDTAAKEMSEYAYFYKMSGLQKFSKNVADQAEVGAGNLNSVVDTVSVLYQTMDKAAQDTGKAVQTNVSNLQNGALDMGELTSSLQTIQADGSNVLAAISAMKNQFAAVGDNPILYVKSLAAVAGNESLDLLKSYAIAAPLAEYFVQRQFGSSRDQANEALIRLGVVDGLDGMNFNLSTVFASRSPEDVHIVVFYKLKLVQFFAFAELEVTVCKEAVTRGWMAGDNPQATVKPAVSAEPSEEESGEEPEESSEEESTEEETTEAETTEEETTEAEITEAETTEPETTAEDMSHAAWSASYDDREAYFFEQFKTFYSGWFYDQNNSLVPYMPDSGAPLMVNGGRGLGQYMFTEPEMYELDGQKIVSGVDMAKRILEVEKDVIRANANINEVLYPIYIPNNVPEETYRIMKAQIAELAEQLSKDMAAEGRNVQFTIPVIKDGGDSDRYKKEGN